MARSLHRMQSFADILTRAASRMSNPSNQPVFVGRELDQVKEYTSDLRARVNAPVSGTASLSQATDAVQALNSRVCARRAVQQANQLACLTAPCLSTMIVFMP